MKNLERTSFVVEIISTVIITIVTVWSQIWMSKKAVKSIDHIEKAE